MVTQRPINLLRGWPCSTLLPTASILRASQAALSDPSISTPGLLYGPDPGYQPLRKEIADWTCSFFGGEKEKLAADPERICITGGASQNLACVLQVFTDPLKTRVWMVAPCYFLACRIFEDSGLKCRGVGEGEEGVDIKAMEEELERVEREEEDVKVCLFHFHLFMRPLTYIL
jgi:DNA-binding transcriptional MocR family regulator